MSAPISDRGIFHRSQPAAQHCFREKTQSQKVVGVAYPSFFCRCCNQPKPAAGRRMIDRANPKLGFACADCAHAACVDAPPVAQKSAPKPEPQPKAEKPAKARKTLLTDEQVLECRAAYEFGGVKPATLVRQYGVPMTYMRALLAYEVRSKLIPKQHKKG